MARIIDDNVGGGITGDWVSPHPTLLEEEDDDDISSKLIPTTPVSGQKKKKKKSGTSLRVGSSCLSGRVYARAGFTAPPMLNITDSCSNTIAATHSPSPYLTIPPGLSPTTLLDSPIFLSNSQQAQPSPTTGKFPPLLNSNGRRRSYNISEAAEEDNLFDDITTSSISFNPVPESTCSFLLGATNKQSFPSVDDVSVRPENALHSQFVRDPSKVYSQNRNIPINMHAHEKENATSDHSPHLGELQDEEGDQRGSGDSMACSGAATSDDGYNWRKYGQKQVKGSEFPRSYYKCTHPTCQVKKKVERSHEGHITEIIYKGAHNHPKPPPNRRSTTVGSSIPVLTYVQSHAPEEHTGLKNYDADGELTGWAISSAQKGNDIADWRRYDNTEVTSSTTLVPEYGGDGTTSLQVPHGSNFESGDAVDASSTFSNNDEDEDDHRTHGSVSLGNNDGEGDESESKRRKIEAFAAEMRGASRAIREPRVVVQTTSEVDILDDGYRWRKYGQKVVKGNPNPRSYYKCISAGCTVRKHVERASHDLKSVITTYEGKHNHDVPVARNSNSSHVNPSVATSQVVQSHIQQPETSQIHGSMVRPFTLPGTGRQLCPSSAFLFGMNQPALPNLSMAGSGPFMGMAQQRQMGFMLPKGEPMMMMTEPIPETGFNLSNNSAVYQQGISRLPLGPHM